jgi:hypothetical protein
MDKKNNKNNFQQEPKFTKQEWENLARKEPGRLENNSIFCVQTKTAQKIVIGRAKGPAGFYKFAGKISQLFKGVVDGDPFAECYLAITYKHLMKAIKKLEALKEEYKQKINQTEGLSLVPYASNEPKGYQIKSKNRYVGLCVRTILLYDQLARMLYVGQDLSVLKEEEVQEPLRQARDAIRYALNVPFRWYYTGVTRYDVRHNTLKAKMAYEKMKIKLSSQILIGTFKVPLISVEKMQQIREQQKQKEVVQQQK